MGSEPLAATDRSQTSRYLGALLDASHRAVATVSAPLDLCVAGRRVRLWASGDRLAAAVLGPVRHLVGAPSGEPDAELFVWDSESSRLAVPAFPWSRADIGPQGHVVGYNDDTMRTVYHGDVNDPPAYGFNALSTWDADRRIGIRWTEAVDRLPPYERLEPIRPLLHWALSDESSHLVHAGALATTAGGILLAGSGWSGKTTTTVAALIDGMQFLGDNYVLVTCDDGEEPSVHAVFGNVKLRAGSLPLLPGLDGLGAPLHQVGDRTALDVAGDVPARFAASAPLRTVVIVERSVSRQSHIRLATSGQALRSLVPSTIAQLPADHGAALPLIARAIRHLPTYVVEVGTPPDSAIPLLVALLEEQ